MPAHVLLLVWLYRALGTGVLRSMAAASLRWQRTMGSGHAGHPAL
ncbi:hypothetical protein [Streptomyces sp. NPDC092129]